MMDFVFSRVVCLVLDAIGYGTASLLLPVLSLGKLRVQRFIRLDDGPFTWSGLSREPDGKILVKEDVATWFGWVFWSLALAGCLTFVG